MDPKRPERIDLAVHDHIHQVAQEILAKSTLLKKAVEEGKLTVIEAYYSLDSGEVSKQH
jgi:carbonic anhydrase